MSGNSPDATGTGDPEPQVPLCRICLCGSSTEALASPCWCRGSIATVHVGCLERWLSQTGNTCCELCLFPYCTIFTLRYGRWESMRMWLRHPRHLHRIRDEILLTTSLTGAMLALSVVSILAVHYFIYRTLEGMTSSFMVGLMTFLISAILVFYCITLFTIMRAEFKMWLSWWRSTINVKVLMNNNSNLTEAKPEESICCQIEQTLLH